MIKKKGLESVSIILAELDVYQLGVPEGEKMASKFLYMNLVQKGSKTRIFHTPFLARGFFSIPSTHQTLSFILRFSTQ